MQFNGTRPNKKLFLSFSTSGAFLHRTSRLRTFAIMSLQVMRFAVTLFWSGGVLQSDSTYYIAKKALCFASLCLCIRCDQNFMKKRLLVDWCDEVQTHAEIRVTRLYRKQPSTSFSKKVSFCSKFVIWHTLPSWLHHEIGTKHKYGQL